MKQRMTIYDTLLWAVLLLMVWGVSSCSDDSEPMDEDTLELFSYSREMEEVTRTATVPAGYQLYVTQHPEVVEEGHAICAYLTIAPSDVSLRRFVYETDHWHSNAIVKNGVDYYIYGYLPMGAIENTTIEPVESDYSSGAYLTLQGLETFSEKDVCVVVGVKGAESVADNVSVIPGYYYYQGKGKDKNHVYLLFDHLYSAVSFSIRVASDYAAMRRIRLKSVVMKTETTEKVNARIKFEAGEASIVSVAYTPRGTAKGERVLLDEERDLTTSYVSFGEICYFAGAARSNLKLVSVYDVYDQEGNLLRENCTAENKLDVLSTIKSGEKRNVKLTVEPTYLHVLSDADLDKNLEIKVN